MLWWQPENRSSRLLSLSGGRPSPAGRSPPTEKEARGTNPLHRGVGPLKRSLAGTGRSRPSFSLPALLPGRLRRLKTSLSFVTVRWH